MFVYSCGKMSVTQKGTKTDFCLKVSFHCGRESVLKLNRSHNCTGRWGQEGRKGEKNKIGEGRGGGKGRMRERGKAEEGGEGREERRKGRRGGGIASSGKVRGWCCSHSW